MVVGGVARLGPQREPNTAVSNLRVVSSRHAAAVTLAAPTTTHVYDTRRIKSEQRRTRELLERLFSLANAMQVRHTGFSSLAS